MKKTLAMLLVLCMVVALCPAAFAADEGSVYWLNFKPESDEALQQIAAMYTEETGVEGNQDQPQQKPALHTQLLSVSNGMDDVE